jgi:hypothetical protein
MPALSSPKAPASMCSSIHVFLFGFETSPRTSGPIPNCPKLPVPQTKGRRPGRFLWGGTGSGLKYGFNCFGAGGTEAGRLMPLIREFRTDFEGGFAAAEGGFADAEREERRRTIIMITGMVQQEKSAHVIDALTTRGRLRRLAPCWGDV